MSEFQRSLTTWTVLLFVFWYCHKRGKEVRLLAQSKAASENEVEASSTESSDIEDEKPLHEADADTWIQEKEAAAKEPSAETEEKSEAVEETASEDATEVQDGMGNDPLKEDEEILHAAADDKAAEGAK